MLARILAWAAAVLVGIALGAASAWAALEAGRIQADVRYGLWTHTGMADARAASPYTRAMAARDDVLALSAREAVSFTLAQDADGRPLDENCVYDLAGRTLDARWWSVTLYAADGYLVRNNDHSASIDAARVDGVASGVWRARVAPVRGDAAHWLSTRAARRNFTLTLRVYNPQRGFTPSEDALPLLTRLSCDGERA